MNWKIARYSGLILATMLMAGCGGGGGGAGAASTTTPPAASTYTVTYVGNGSTGGTPPVDATAYPQGQLVTVLGNVGSLVKSGSTFSGWNTAANGSGTTYAAGQTFAIGAANVVLYAKWATPSVLGYAYTVNQYDYSISQLTIGPNGALSSTSFAAVPTEVDPNRLAVDPAGKYLYAVNLKGGASNTGGSISQYSIGANGGLTAMSPPDVAQGIGPTDVAVHPSGKWAYAVSSKNPGSTVVQFTVGATGGLTSTSSAPLPSNFPQYLAIDPSGKHLYVAVQGQVDGVAQFSIDQTTGALTALTPAYVPFIGKGATAFAITVHPSGKYAYVTDYYGAISEYTIDATTGALSPLAQTKVDSAVQLAAWITVDPTGKYAYAANAASPSAAISQYTVGADGSLTPMTPASVAASSGATNVQVDASGSYLYMTSGLGTSGATNVVSQYLIGTNGTLTPMNPASVSVGLGPNAIVLVKK